jgi:hypothetical protein
MSFDNKNDKRIVINAKGVRYEALVTALGLIQNSRLSQLKEFIELKHSQLKTSDLKIEEICDGYTDNFEEFYFNKDPNLVLVILKFYENDKSSDGSSR